MKLSELMAKIGVLPDPTFQGDIISDDWIFAIGQTPTDSIEDYLVATTHISSQDAQLNPETEDTEYIREGKVTVKTGVQRTINVTGGRYVGDGFQDFVLSHKLKYATGSGAILPYVWFNARDGKGETGNVTVSVNSDSGGEAAGKTEFDVDFLGAGGDVLEYQYGSTSTVPVTGVTISQSTATLSVGDTLNLSATVSPSTATNTAITWSSSDTSVATVSATTGKVTVKATGSATIIVTTKDGSFTDSCAVTVS